MEGLSEVVFGGGPAPVLSPQQAEQVIETLEPLLLDRRVERMQQVLATRSDRVAFVFERMVDPHNLSAVLRSMDAFSFQDAHLIDPQEKIGISKGITSGAERWLSLHKHGQTPDCLNQLKAQGYKVLASHVAPGRGIHLEEIDFSQPTALVYGNEHFGVGEEVLALADETFHIPMRGMVESFNLSVAAAVCAFHARHTLENTQSATPAPEGFLLPTARVQSLYAAWLIGSVRRARSILAEKGISLSY